MEPDRQIIIRPFPFQAPRVMAAPRGWSVRRIIERMYDESGTPPICRDDDLLVEIDGEALPRDRWSLMPEAGSHVLVCVPVRGGGGGKDPLRTVLMIAVVVAAAAATSYIGGAGGWAMTAGGLGAKSAAMVGGLAGAAVATAGMMLVDAIAPIRYQDAAFSSSQTQADSPTYGIAPASNRIAPFGPIPVVLGRHRMYPFYGARPYTEIVGNDEYLRMLFVWGYGPLKIEDLKLGDTLLSQFQDVQVETREGRPFDPPITLIPKLVYQDPVGSGLLTAAGGRVVRAAHEGVDEISVDLAFPRGLASIANDGTRVSHSVEVLIEYREVGTSNWQALSFERPRPISGTTHYPSQMHNDTYSVYVEPGGSIGTRFGTNEYAGYYRIAQYVVAGGAIYNLVNLNPPGVTGLQCSVHYQEQFDEWGTTYKGVAIVVQSGTAGTASLPATLFTDATTSLRRYGHKWEVDRNKNYEVGITRLTPDSTDDRVIDQVHWSVIRGFRNDAPVKLPHPLAMTAIRIRATEQLQGVVDNLNGIVTSYATTWNGEAWVGESLTQNQAALFRLVLMSPANARRRGMHQIANADLGQWYEFCANNGYAFNMIRDFRTSVWETLADIAASGRGSPSLTDGVWNVTCDTGTQPLVHHISPVNSWGFAAEKKLFYRPHAFRVPFTNEEKGYEPDELIVYDDGYSAANATDFETLKFPGLTKSALNWRFGRFHIAQARLRPETYSLYQDFEHLVVRRGSKARISHDVPMWGSGWGRVKRVIFGAGADYDKAAGVILTEKVLFEAGVSYACRFRLADAVGTSLVLSVVNPGTTETDTLTFQALIPLQDAPKAGDMAMFGEATRETVEVLVKGIERASDYTARLILVDASPEIYAADQGEIPAFDSQITGPVDMRKIPPAVPVIYEILSGTAAQAFFAGAIVIIHIHPQGGFVRTDRYRIRYRRSPSILWEFAETSTESLAIRIEGAAEGEIYQIQAQAISVHGVESAWTDLTEHAVGGAPLVDILSELGDVAVGPYEDGVMFSWPTASAAGPAGFAVRAGVHWRGGAVYAAGNRVVPTDGTERRYRCITAGTSGTVEPAWPESGSVSDGGVEWVEDGADWPESYVTDPAFWYDLSIEEKIQQGRDSLTVRAWVQGHNAFGWPVTYRATAAGGCLNQKPFINVGFTSTMGIYDTLEAAVAHLPGGGGLHIKNGIYTLADELVLPPQGLTLVGESRDGVVIRNAAGKHGMTVRSDSNGLYQLLNLTLESRNEFGGYSTMLRTLPAGSNQDYSIDIDNIKMVLADDGAAGTGGTGDIGIHLATPMSANAKVSFKNSIIQGGMFGIFAYSDLLASLLVFYNKFFDCTRSGLSSSGKGLHDIQNNELYGMRYRGIEKLATFGKLDRVNVLNNVVQIAPGAGLSSCLGIIVTGTIGTYNGDGEISGNRVRIQSEGALPSTIGIRSGGPQQKVTNNRIEIAAGAASNNGLIGLSVVVHWATARGNFIHIGTQGNANRGIQIESGYNEISENLIDMGSANATDIGIYLPTGAANNRGRNNIFTGTARDIVNEGIGNTINQSIEDGNIDGGTW